MLELAFRLRIGFFEAMERFLDLRRCPLRQSTGGRLGVGRLPLPRRLQFGVLLLTLFSAGRLGGSLADGLFRHDFGYTDRDDPRQRHRTRAHDFFSDADAAPFAWPRGISRSHAVVWWHKFCNRHDV